MNNEERILSLLEKHDATLEKHSATLEKHSAMHQKHDATLKKIDETVARHDIVLAGHDIMLANLTKGQAKLERDVADIKIQLREHSSAISGIKNQLNENTELVRAALGALHEINAKVSGEEYTDAIIEQLEIDVSKHEANFAAI